MTKIHEDAYLREAKVVGRIAFSHWQREPTSPSFGCFDRQYWGWKKKDLADGTLQAAVSVALHLAEREGVAHTLPELIDGYVGFLERIQHRDGSFDQIYPFEHAPGVVHDMLTPLIALWRSPHTPATTQLRLEAVIHKAVAYALTADEKHGDIANHFAHYAWELIHYGCTFGHAAAEAYGQRYLARTMALLDMREGWFREYDGADAGYQTRLLSYLTRIADLTGESGVWAAAGTAARFIETMLMPDGSLHPMLGVRSTAIVYPAGFERLARREPAFAALADRVHDGWTNGVSPLPSLIDFENGLRLADDAIEASAERAARIAAAPTAPQKAPSPAEPTAAAEPSLDLAVAGLHRRRLATPRGQRTVFVASRLGGVVVAYDEAIGGRARLAHENAGYLVVLADGTRWLTRRAEAGRIENISPTVIEVTVGFSRSLHEDLTPVKLVALRLLNLTVLRSQFAGDLFRKVVVARLISGRKDLGVTCRRRIELTDDGAVLIRDRLVADPAAARRLAGGRLFRCRRAIANHMASSRYFQPAELALDQAWLEELPVDQIDGRVIELRLLPPSGA